MFFSGLNMATALVAVTALSQASLSVAGHGRGLDHHRRILHAAHDHKHFHAKRANAGSVELPVSQLQQLQSEYAAFKSWVEDGFKSSSSMDSATYMAQFKQEFTAYDGWMSSWLESALPSSGSSSAGPVVQSSSLLPVSSSNVTSSVYIIPVVATATSKKVSVSSAAASAPKKPASSAVAKPSSPASQASAAPSPAPAPPAPAVNASSAAPPAPSGSAPSSGGTFNAAASNNVAVYYGQSPATSSVKLSQICSDSSVDIVILAFLSTFSGPGGFPTLNLGAACSPTAGGAAAAKGATGLLSCPDVAQEIKACQSAGKKVLLSLGGATGVTAFASDAAASAFATQLTNLFTGGSDASLSALRPFGSVKLDGFDIDNEDHSTAFYSTFTTALRTAMDADTSKTYYISSAPQCPRPDASIPLDAMQVMDFVFVQFYNNGDCNVGASGFLDSFAAWSGDLSAKGKGPRLFIGAPACQACAGSGYNAPSAMSTQIASAMGKKVPNFGGVMLWDAAEAVTNGNYQQAVKKALEG